MKEEFTFTLSPDCMGGRLDQVVASYLQENHNPDFTREKIRLAIVGGAVTLNSRTVTKAGHKVRGGELVEIFLEKIPSDLIPDSLVEFEVLHEDDSIIIVNKPAGLVVHPGAGTKESTLVHGILSRYTLEEQGSGERPGIVHRLDRGTSGLMVIAKTTRAKLHLQAQFKPPRTIHREYLCIAKGNIQVRKGVKYLSPNGRIEVPLLRSDRNRTTYASNFSEGKEAITNFEILKSNGSYHLIKCILETGRTHQIRAHLKYIGMPIVGDTSYGGEKRGEWPMLHAKALKFIHPETSEEVSFVCDVPEYFKVVSEEIFNEVC